MYTGDTSFQMSKTSVITARVTQDIAASLDALAARVERSRAWLIAQAIEEYVKDYTEFLDFIKEGEDAIDRGDFYTQEEMEAWFAEKIAAGRVATDQARAA